MTNKPKSSRCSLKAQILRFEAFKRRLKLGESVKAELEFGGEELEMLLKYWGNELCDMAEEAIKGRKEQPDKDWDNYALIDFESFLQIHILLGLPRGVEAVEEGKKEDWNEEQLDKIVKNLCPESALNWPERVLKAVTASENLSHNLGMVDKELFDYKLSARSILAFIDEIHDLVCGKQAASYQDKVNCIKKSLIELKEKELEFDSPSAA